MAEWSARRTRNQAVPGSRVPLLPQPDLFLVVPSSNPNVMSFRVLTVHCKISLLEAIISIKD